MIDSGERDLLLVRRERWHYENSLRVYRSIIKKSAHGHRPIKITHDLHVNARVNIRDIRQRLEERLHGRRCVLPVRDEQSNFDVFVNC